MPINQILSKLEGVRQTGRNRWMACCPAHDDKTASLAVTEADDGRVLLHCFAGCHTSDVLQSIGLTYGDLYPIPAHAHLPPVRKPFNAHDVLSALSLEVLVAYQYAKLLALGDPLSDSDMERLLLCANRFNAALGVING